MNRRNPSRWLWYAPAALWAAVLLFSGGQTDVSLPEWPLPVDKIGHFLGYATLGALLALGWRRAGGRPHAVVTVLLALVVGAADELHQRDVAGRTSEMGDWVADAAGIVIGFAAVARIRTRTGRGR